MSLIERSRADLRAITENTSDFAQVITLTAPGEDGAILDVNGFHTHHHNGFDENGVPVSSRISSVAISEGQLRDAEYPYTDSDGNTYLVNHFVTTSDSDSEKMYIVREQYPDQNLGLIVLILGVYATD
jgi:hypothetical protein